MDSDLCVDTEPREAVLGNRSQLALRRAPRREDVEHHLGRVDRREDRRQEREVANLHCLPQVITRVTGAAGTIVLLAEWGER